VNKSIAFFDFDGTITNKDTLLEMIRYQKGVLRFYSGFLLHAPWLVAFKLGILSNHAAKQRILRHFFGRMPVERFQQRCDEFSFRQLTHILQPKALKEIRLLQRRGTEVVVVSASPSNWISKWAAGIGVQVIATELETRNGRMTGRIQGKNCHGKEKEKRIRETYDLSQYTEIYAYGDSPADQPMLALAHLRFFKPFR
jgi:HAD superfamily hydrolase (TIGR01490 family)